MNMKISIVDERSTPTLFDSLFDDVVVDRSTYSFASNASLREKIIASCHFFGCSGHVTTDLIDRHNTQLPSLGIEDTSVNLLLR